MSSWPDERVTLFARANFRNDRRVFGIKQKDRRSHMYILGKTGTGKSTLLETMARQDIGADQGVAVLDPHGDLVERLVRALPDRRRNDLIYFDLSAPASALAFNPLDAVAPGTRGLTASFLLDVFQKLWPDSWGPRLEHILRNALLALLEQPQATLVDVLRLLDDRAFRREAAGRVYNRLVRDFWLREFEGYPARFRAEAIAPIQNKVGAFLANPVLQRILGQPRSAFNLRQAMDQGQVLLVNLAKGKVGEGPSLLLGALLVSAIQVAALSRGDTPEEERRDFFMFLDEFPGYTTSGLATMLAELRKYRVALTLSHQHLTQLEPAVRDAILGNVGTTVLFRLGPVDAEVLERWFQPEFSALDMMGLPNYHVYLKLMINGVVSRGFSAELLVPTCHSVAKQGSRG